MIINKKSNILLVFVLMTIMLFSFSFVSSMSCEASGWKGFAKLNENKTVCVTCPTCNFINISTVTPNGTLLFQNEPMIETNSEFCYEYNGIQNNQLGTYEINGYSQLSEPLGLCWDTTFSGRENNIGAYIIGILLVVGILMGLVWISNKYNKKERERLYQQVVLGFFNAKKEGNKTDFATMILYLLGYGILDMLFVFYYLDIIMFFFIFKDLAVSFGLNTFSLMMPELIKISLYGLIIIGAFLTLKLYNVVKMVIDDVQDAMRGIYE